MLLLTSLACHCVHNTSKTDGNIMGACILSFIFFLIPYTVICSEFPRRIMYAGDPWWMVILKMWGGIFGFLITTVFIALLFEAR